MNISTMFFLGLLFLLTVTTSKSTNLSPRLQEVFEKEIVDEYLNKRLWTTQRDRRTANVLWDYSSNGPSTWSSNFPGCVGSSQSPVNLRENSATALDCSDLKFTDYDSDHISLTVENVRGVSATARVIHSEPPRVSGGCLKGIYRLEKIMWHWGESVKQGSEHYINDRSLSMEMQLVHYEDKYGSYEEALKYKGAVVIIAVLYKESGATEHHGYDDIAKALRRIIMPDTRWSVSYSKRLSTLMPKNKKQYYMYEGSITHPKCEQGVTWIVFKHYGKLSHFQIRPFRDLKTNSEENLVNNFRPLQRRSNKPPIYKIGF